jgi:tetratricopeptide (TPR) repeat protein
VARIDSEFEERLSELLKEQIQIEDNPELLLKLGSHYEQYANLGILGLLRKKDISDKALYFYQKYLKLSPLDLKVELSIGSLLFHAGYYQEFLTWYQKFEDRFKVVPNLVRSWYLEALYKQNQFELLSQATRSF